MPSIVPEPAAAAANTKEMKEKVGNPIIITLKIFLCGVIASSACVLIAACSFWLNPCNEKSITYYIWVQLWLAFFMDTFLLCTISSSVASFHRCNSHNNALTFYECLKITLSRAWVYLVLCYGLTFSIWAIVAYIVNDPSTNTIYIITVFIAAFTQSGINSVMLSLKTREFYLNETMEGRSATLKNLKRRALGSLKPLAASLKSTLISLMPFIASNCFVVVYFFSLKIIASTSSSFKYRTALFAVSVGVKFGAQSILRLAVLRRRKSTKITTASTKSSRTSNPGYTKETVMFAFSYLSVFLDSQLRIYISDESTNVDVAISAFVLGVCELIARVVGSTRVSRMIAMKRQLVGNSKGELEEFAEWKAKRLKVHLWQVQANMVSEYISIIISVIAQSTAVGNNNITMKTLAASALIQVGIELPMDAITLMYDRYLSHPIGLNRNLMQYVSMQSGIALICTVFAIFSVS